MQASSPAARNVWARVRSKIDTVLDRPERQAVSGPGGAVARAASADSEGQASPRSTPVGEAARQLDNLARLAGRAAGAPDPELLANLGWVVATQPDSPLPLRLLHRTLAGGATHPGAAALARFLVMRSVRCRKLADRQLELARSVLRMLTQLRPEDARPGAWIGIAYMLAGQYSEAGRVLGSARGSGYPPAARAAAAVGWLMMGRPGSPVSVGRGQGGGVGEPADPAIRALDPNSGVVRLVDGGPALSADHEAVLTVRAVRRMPVVLVGRRATVTLSALEGELAVALLSLSWAGEGERSAPGGCLPRGTWIGAVWPLADDPVGRLLGLFSAVVRRLRAKAHQACGEPVIEASHREGYRLRAGLPIGLEMDVASLLGNWLLARVPAPVRW